MLQLLRVRFASRRSLPAARDQHLHDVFRLRHGRRRRQQVHRDVAQQGSARVHGKRARPVHHCLPILRRVQHHKVIETKFCSSILTVDNEVLSQVVRARVHADHDPRERDQRRPLQLLGRIRRRRRHSQQDDHDFKGRIYKYTQSLNCSRSKTHTANEFVSCIAKGFMVHSNPVMKEGSN